MGRVKGEGVCVARLAGGLLTVRQDSSYRHPGYHQPASGSLCWGSKVDRALGAAQDGGKEGGLRGKGGRRGS